MLRGLYIAATGMIQQNQRMDTIANNLANANTRGYKRDMVVNRSFREELLYRMSKDDVPAKKKIGTFSRGVYVNRLVVSFEQGNLEYTGEKTDIALSGQGFFKVQTNEGERYTRDSSFIINSQGFLATTQGNILLGEDGPIQVGQSDFVINSDGSVVVDGQAVNRVDVANFENLDALEKTGANLFVNTDPANAAVPFEGEVLHRFGENSNVQPIQETVDMITTSRNYESNQKIIRMLDETLGKTVNDVGRV